MRQEREEEQKLSSPSDMAMLQELSYMIINVLKPIPISSLLRGGPPASSSSPSSSQGPGLPLAFSQVSPAAFASLFLGISLALMLFGSVAFVIGFVLMPWIIGFVFLFCLAGFVSKLTEFAQSFFCCSCDFPSWKLS